MQNFDLLQTEGRVEPFESVRRRKVRTDPQGRAMTWNAGVQRVLGFSEAELRARSSSVRWRR